MNYTFLFCLQKRLGGNTPPQLIIIKAPELHAIQGAHGFHVDLLRHQPVLVINHRQHMVVLVLVLELQGPIRLELFLHTLN